MTRRRLVGVAATLLAVALGSAAVALVAVPDHRSTSIRITQLAAAAAVVISAIAAVAVVAAADAFARRSNPRPAPDEPSSPALQADGAGHPVGLWVTLTGEGHRPFLVVSAERENATFLVARDDEQAQWVPKDRIEAWAVRPPQD